MALTNGQILQLIADNIPDNTANFITPELTREVLNEMAGSYANLISNVTNLGLTEWSNTKTYPLGQCVVLDKIIYQSIVANTNIGTFIPTDWQDITSGTNGTGQDFVLKTNAIVLKDNKLVEHLTQDEFLRSLDTGFYTTLTPTIFGLTEEYPINKRGESVVNRRSSCTKLLVFARLTSVPLTSRRTTRVPCEQKPFF